MKFEFIDNHRSEFSVEKMCRVLDVSRSGYYRFRTAPESDRKKHNEALYMPIKTTYDASHGTLAARGSLVNYGIKASGAVKIALPS